MRGGVRKSEESNSVNRFLPKGAHCCIADITVNETSKNSKRYHK